MQTDLLKTQVYSLFYIFFCRKNKKIWLENRFLFVCLCVCVCVCFTCLNLAFIKMRFSLLFFSCAGFFKVSVTQ